MGGCNERRDYFEGTYQLLSSLLQQLITIHNDNTILQQAGYEWSPFWCRNCRAVAMSRMTKLASCSVRCRRLSIVSNSVPPSIFSNTTKNLSSSSKYSISCRMFSCPRQWWKISISFSTLLRLLCWFFSMI